MTQSSEILVVGGGMFGAAIAYGLVRLGHDVIMLDEGDHSLRTARANFGLVWTQAKGKGLHRYHDWSVESGVLWRDFAPQLLEDTGIDVKHRTGGGLDILIGDEQRANKQQYIDEMKAQAEAAGSSFEVKILDRREAQELLPNIRLGQEVSGASYSAHDGDCNPLRLLRAMHAGFQKRGGRYIIETKADRVSHDGRFFVTETSRGKFQSDKIVIACGHGIGALAPMVGLDAPNRPQRGQVLITERVEASLDYCVTPFRQTNEGGFQLGNSEEDVGFDDWTTLDITQRIAERAVRAFPQLAGVRLVRTWAGTRVLTPDKCAIYDESESHPGAFVATSHSGVTLAAINAHHIAKWVSNGETEPGFEQFSAKRFDVSKAS
ncbi:MAG: FAD-dependent oxidoreductase [Rhodospirillaceae bacterium]|mgnify:CR=1 FL=1|nr:FAD-dependent oxidoreductase [Rhodospirillaceae bacterium]